MHGVRSCLLHASLAAFSQGENALARSDQGRSARCESQAVARRQPERCGDETWGAKEGSSLNGAPSPVLWELQTSSGGGAIHENCFIRKGALDREEKEKKDFYTTLIGCILAPKWSRATVRGSCTQSLFATCNVARAMPSASGDIRLWKELPCRTVSTHSGLETC